MWKLFKKAIPPPEPTPLELTIDFIFALLKDDPDGWSARSNNFWDHKGKGIKIYLGDHHTPAYSYVTIDIPKFKWDHEDIPQNLRHKVWVKFSKDPNAVRERDSWNALEQLIKEK